MSALAIRAALEIALSAMTPNMSIAWENTPFSPTVGAPFAQVTLLLAQPANDEFGSTYRQDGFLQVDLKYPIGNSNATNGAGFATARAELIRTTFPRGASFTASGVTVNITRTPEIMPGRTEEDRFVIPVRIPFHAHVRSA